MRRALNTLAFLLALGAIPALAAITPNPLFRSNPLATQPLSPPTNSAISSPLGSSAIARPAPVFGPVTPVPEPSTWAMMLGGLVLLGFVVRLANNR